MPERLEHLQSAALRLTREKLSAFVSSTIQECGAERALAKKAVESLNHSAFVFEAVGARPWPPVEIYLPGLYAADVFVAVYKHSYGWIGPGQSISGLEDEFRHAIKRGMPVLVYVYSGGGVRDERLAQLIKDIQSRGLITYAPYREPDELYPRIRDDIEAVVANRFLRGVEIEAAVAAYQPPLGNGQIALTTIVRRRRAENLVLAALEEGGKVQVSGDSGSGKTTLLASLAEHRGFLFLSASQLSLLDLINAITTKLGSSHGLSPIYGSTLVYGIEVLRSAWSEVEACTLVLDDVADEPTIRQIVMLLEPLGGKKRIAYSVRSASQSDTPWTVVVPPFDTDEAQSLFELLNRRLPRDEVDRIVNLTNGNALLLRYCAEYGGSAPESGLTAFETFKWSQMAARAQEIVAYLALSETRLTLEEVVSLSESGSVAAATSDIAEGSWFLVEDRFGYGMRHHHQRETVLSILQSTPQKINFYARRVAEVMSKKGDVVSAFLILSRTNDPSSANYGRPALFEVGRRGDWKRILDIGTAMLARAREEHDVSDTVQLLVQVAEAAQHVGDLSRSNELMSEATELADGAGFEYLNRFVRAARVCRDAALSLTSASIDALRRLRDEYETAGQVWASAKLSLDLSALLVRLDLLEDAAKEARSAHTAFEKVGDDYGVNIALRNLATALSAVPTAREEFSEILRQIEERSGATDSNQRERAWLCNVLVRRFRVAKQFERAKGYADEAIRIGNELGDQELVSINTMNLANVYRDQGKLDDALRQYEMASALASRVQKRELEARCARLSSAVHLQKHQVELAIQYASFGCSVVRNTIAIGETMACYEQLGDSQLAARREKDAADSYLEGASYGLRTVESDEAWDLAEQGLRWFATRRRLSEYVAWLDRLLKCEYKTSVVGAWQASEALFIRLLDLIRAVNREHSVGLVVLHTHLMLDGLPPPVSRFLFERSARAICDEVDSAGSDVWRRLFPLLALLSTVPANAIGIQDMVSISERVSEKTPSFYFSVRADGLPTWVFTLELANPVICSVTAIDNNAESAVVSLALMLFLKGFEAEIASQVVGTAPATRQEVQIYVMSAENIPDSVKKFVEPHLSGQVCTVSRPTDPGDPDSVPTMVYFKPGITGLSSWDEEEIAGLEVLFGYALLEVVYQILQGEVDLDVLAPKIARLVRQNVCLAFTEPK
jgi:tetratricopeptide (TPR) repeat protein